MLQDRVNDLLRQFNEKYEECLRRWLHDTGTPMAEAVAKGRVVTAPVGANEHGSYNAFEFCGKEVYRVTIDEHFAIVTKWSQPCE